MLKAIVTGATGYIGQNLTKKLVDSGWTIGIIKRCSSDVGCFDQLTNLSMFNYDGSYQSIKNALLEFKPEVIFHIAAESSYKHSEDDIDQLIQSNVLFGTHILEAMVRSDVKKIINTSTFWLNPDGRGYHPKTLYTSLKQAFENILKYYSEVFDINCISLRLPDIYGPEDKRKKILNYISNAAINGEIIKMSHGEQEMDLVFIDDAVDAFIRAYHELNKLNNNYMEFSISSKDPISLKQIVEKFVETNNISLNIIWGALSYRENEIMKLVVPNNILPNWECKTSLEIGLQKLYKGVHLS